MVTVYSSACRLWKLARYIGTTLWRLGLRDALITKSPE
jgi:hypothetical protein